MQGTLRSLDIQLGQTLKLVRKSRKYSQIALAQALGITFQQVQKYETGVNRISASRLMDICRILKMSVQDFYALIEPGNDSPDPLLTAQTAQLTALFAKISDARLRAALLGLLSEIAAPATPS